jgi:hypothetical protein
MLISKEHQCIFISNPKTGTSAVSKHLKSQDESWETNRFNKEDGLVLFDEHEYPNSIKNKIPFEYEKFKKFVFIRHPYDKVVSAYFFLKNGNPLTYGSVWNYRKKRKNFFRAITTYLNMIFARIVPFRIWSILRPVKKNSSYLMSKDGVFLVNCIGLTERLNDDLKSISVELEFNQSLVSEVSRVNTSSHKSYTEYFQGRFHKWCFDWVYKKEIKLYELVKEKGCTFNFENTSIKNY